MTQISFVCSMGVFFFISLCCTGHILVSSPITSENENKLINGIHDYKIDNSTTK